MEDEFRYLQRMDGSWSLVGPDGWEIEFEEPDSGVMAAVAAALALAPMEWVTPAVVERRGMDAAILPAGYPHEAPDRPMSVFDAKLTMQRHRACRVGECPGKTVAWNILVDTRRITPDSGRQC